MLHNLTKNANELLNQAIIQNNLHLVKYLLENDSRARSLIYFPLEIATRIGNKKIIKLLIQNGALCTSKCFMNAIRSNRSDIVQLLLQTKTSDSVKVEALIEASKLGLQSIVHIFIENGLSVNSYDPFTDFSPIYMAASHGHYEIVIYLIKRGAFLRRNAELITFVSYPNIMRLFFSLKYEINYSAQQFITAGYVVPYSKDPLMKSEYKKLSVKKHYSRKNFKSSFLKKILNPKSMHIQLTLL
jgi:hypothetical protein